MGWGFYDFKFFCCKICVIIFVINLVINLCDGDVYMSV